ALNAAASVFETRFADNLTAITSSGPNDFSTKFFNPSTPGADVILSKQSLATDAIRIYAGAADLGGSTLGIGGPGGYDCSGFSSFCNTDTQRGQGETQNLHDSNGALLSRDAVDVAPWGGSISFDNASTNWYFGLTTAGLNSSEYDFYSVAVHELAHVLGFGASDSFKALTFGSDFIGASTGSVALSADLAHWADGTLSTVNGVSQETAMSPAIYNGQRKYFTALDFAAMQDIGWQVTAVPEADTWAMLLAGLGLVGFAARRRTA
ncbi:MAG: PEPxxWA-CTERM sorting domain-containing protein, partial [Proteobacteria bacterium]|nr:PEPxxWA-CTERM sorting domain-containing protein [Pseudomonadota bacterium]